MKPIKNEIAFSTPWFEIVGKTMRDDEAPYYSLRTPDYASVVAMTPEDRIVIVRQYRPAVERYTFELPSGIVDSGEMPVDAARRELLEETGYEVSEMEPVGAMDPDTGRLGNRIWGYFGRGARRLADREAEPGIEVLEWTTEDLSREVLGGRFDHALHVAILFRAILNGKLPMPLPGDLRTTGEASTA